MTPVLLEIPPYRDFYRPYEFAYNENEFHFHLAIFGDSLKHAATTD